MTKKPSPSPQQINAFHHALQEWYNRHGRRDLPWRNTHDPYAIYLSEIMLQQTQVKTVLERYYVPFLKKFPTLTALAKADKQSVIKQWEGLGYYNRAANLHATAIACNGALPETLEALQKLPGIGRNTASAVACFAFRKAVPVMEANIRRILCRVFALKEVNENILWEKAELLLDKQNAFDYNQAMMDIGALVCRKSAPQCSLCPLNALCQGKTSPESYPQAKAPKTNPVRSPVIVVLKDRQGGYYLRRRESRFLHGLYGFPEYTAGTKEIAYNRRHYPLEKDSIIGQVRQVYSHFTLQSVVHMITVTGKPPSGLYRATLAEMRELPLSRADHKILAMLN